LGRFCLILIDFGTILALILPYFDLFWPYFPSYAPLVALEADEDMRGCEMLSRDNVTVRWESTATATASGSGSGSGGGSKRKRAYVRKVKKTKQNGWQKWMK
jgi:hypothetical protein